MWEYGLKFMGIFMPKHPLLLRTLPSAIPIITDFNNHLFFILQICPNSFSLQCAMSFYFLCNNLVPEFALPEHFQLVGASHLKHLESHTFIVYILAA